MIVNSIGCERKRGGKIKVRTGKGKNANEKKRHHHLGAVEKGHEPEKGLSEKMAA